MSSVRGMKKCILLLGLCALLLTAAALAPSLAWYRPIKTNFGPANIDGAVRASYFQSGNGKSAGQIVKGYQNEAPIYNSDAGYGESDYNGTSGKNAAYEIKTPEQFYNLAWLQYLGCFNEPDEDGAVPATYFYLSADLDMKGYVLPPIGTSDYPFIGSFDGCGHTVSNLTVSNVLDSEDMAVDEQLKNAEIVGVFGVVGSLAAETNGTESSAALDTEKNYTYSSITNKVENVTFSNVTIRTETDKALIGLAAGYVNGTLENVGVANSKLDIKAGTAALTKTTTITTDDLSDYSLVGYCTAPYLDGFDEVEVQHSAPTTGEGEKFEVSEEDAGDGTGGDGGWGGSLDMRALYTRSMDIYTGDAIKSVDSFKTYTDAEKGSFCFNNGSDKNPSYFYLFGKIKDKELWLRGSVATSLVEGNTYSISATSGTTTHYLSAGAKRVKDTISEYNTVQWTASADTSGRLGIYTVLNGMSYYLVKTASGVLGVSITPSYVWSVSGAVIEHSDGGKIAYDNGWTLNNNGSSLTFTNYIEPTVSDNLVDTCIPLKVNADGKVANGNTGYIVGGTGYHKPQNTMTVSGQGDIRVLKYTFARISDAYHNGEPTVYAPQIDFNHQISDGELTAYEETKTKFVSAVGKDSNYVYSMRFYGGVIDRYATVSQVKIGNETKIDYEMPEACIDFNLASRGSIKFFASTYGVETKSFFSLHQIFRDENDKITDVKEISKIYEKAGGGYEYAYVGEPDTCTGALKFDTSILTKQYGYRELSRGNAPGDDGILYYFEIPMNKGEYALGAVSNGAALLYLDIGANGEDGDGENPDSKTVTITRTRTDEVVTTTTKSYIVPKGVDFVANAAESQSVERATAVKTLGTDASGIYTYTFNVDSKAFTCNNAEMTVNANETTVMERRVTLDYTLPDSYDGELKAQYPRQVRITCDGDEKFTYEERVGANGEWTPTSRDTLHESKLVSGENLQLQLPTEDGIKELSVGTSVLTYSFELPTGESFTRDWSFTGGNSGGTFTVTLKTSQETLVKVSVTNGYTVTFNGTEVSDNAEINTQIITQSIRRAPLLLRPPVQTDSEPEDEPIEETAEAVHYTWTDMTDEEFLAWAFERRNWKEIRSVSVMDADSTALRDLYAKADGLARADERQSALERLDLIYTSWPCFWIDMTDEEFIWWFMNEGINDELLEILKNPESEECVTLLQRIEDIEDEAQRLAAKARLEELRKLLAQHPWEKQTDEDFVYWLSDDTNLVAIKNILADEESEAYASLLARVAAIKDEALRAQAEARLALIRRLLPKKYDWDTQTDEDFVYWLRDDTNVSAVRAALDDPLAELSLRERIRAIVDAALRALAEARLEEIRASDGIYGTDKDTEIVQPGGGVYEVEDDTEIVQPPSPGGTYGIGSDTEVSPPSSGSGGLYRNGADTQLISVADAAETGNTLAAVFLPAWSAPAPVQMAALPSVDSIPRSGKGKYGR